MESVKAAEQTEKIVSVEAIPQEVVPKRKGRPKGSKDKNPGSRPSTKGKAGTFTKEQFNAKEPGKNARYLRFALEGYHLPPVDLDNAEQVEERIDYYFRRCMEEDHKPGVVGLSNYLGIDRITFFNWVHGNIRAGTHLNIAKRAYAIMEGLWEDYMQNGQINPVSGIFLGKNHFGYQDRTEVVQVQKDPLAEGASPAEIASRYAQAVVAEDPAPLPIEAESSAEETENISAEDGR